MSHTIAGIVARKEHEVTTHLPGVPPRAQEQAVAVDEKGWASARAQFTGRYSTDDVSGTFCVASARVDNRGELLRALGLDVREWGESTPESTRYDDTHLIHAAYLRWRESCVERIYGDWAFAVWRPLERQLFLARDHFGMTSMYYAIDDDSFAFASDQQVLLDANLAPSHLDEFYIAQVLVSWPVYHSERTVRTGINRLPPAHTITVDPYEARVRQYWFLEDAPELSLADPREYVEGFREVFDEAVRARLRRDEGGKVGATLSGGLDSSSITATAAGLLAAQSERLQAYTSVPIADTRKFVGSRFGDEWPEAQATVACVGGIDHHAITAESVTPIQGIRRNLQIHHEPMHAAGNAYWLVDLNATAAQAGCSVLLIGQVGNAGISWPGSPLSHSIPSQITRLGPRRWTRESTMRHVPRPVLWQWRQFRQSRATAGGSMGTALNPALAARLDLARRRRLDPDEYPARTPREQRMWLQPGRSFVGALHAQAGRAAGIDIRDPSGDARVLAYTWSIPDQFYYDPATRTDRRVIREAMQGRLPDQVRLNTRRGRQAGDICIRLRRSADEVEEALEQVEASEAASEVVDVSVLRSAWRIVAEEDSPRAFRLAVTTLTRGLMAGLFVAEQA